MGTSTQSKNVEQYKIGNWVIETTPITKRLKIALDSGRAWYYAYAEAEITVKYVIPETNEEITVEQFKERESELIREYEEDASKVSEIFSRVESRVAEKVASWINIYKKLFEYVESNNVLVDVGDDGED